MKQRSSFVAFSCCILSFAGAGTGSGCLGEARASESKAPADADRAKNFRLSLA